MNSIAPHVRPATLQRGLALATHLSRWHDRTAHHLSGSDAQSLSLREVLALAGDEDRARWEGLGLGYTDPAGSGALRGVIAAGYAAGDPAQVLCFAGAQEALFAAVQAILTPQDHAIVVLPCYPALETLPLGVCAVSGVALEAPGRGAGAGWTLDIDAVAAAMRPNTRLLIVGFPNNPTGMQIGADGFAALVALCRRHGVWLLSDEVYRLTERDPRAVLPQAADVYERGVSLGGMSKSYGLPGLRVAWIACSDAGLRARMAAVKQSLSACLAGPSEVLAEIALKAGPAILARNRAIIDVNLALLEGFFARHGAVFDCAAPNGRMSGGMVCYPRYAGAEGVDAFVRRMAQAGILLLPGRVFRSELCALPDGHFRLGFGKSGFAAGLAALEAAIGAAAG